MRPVLSLTAVLVALAGAACIRAPSSSGAFAPRSDEPLGTLPSAEEIYPLCPPAIAASQTDVQDMDDGVVVDVTSNDDRGAAQIRQRADALLAAVGDAEHTDFTPGARGGLSHCPIVVESTRVSIVSIDRGTRFVVRTQREDAAWLKGETRARLLELRVPIADASPALARCPSALPTALTSVRDVEDSVEITVVSRNPDVTDAIRARAWHVAAESRGIGPRDDDRGGGAQCPIRIAGASVDAVDVPGGSRITLRAGEIEGVAFLRRTVRERVARLP